MHCMFFADEQFFARENSTLYFNCIVCFFRHTVAGRLTRFKVDLASALLFFTRLAS